MRTEKPQEVKDLLGWVPSKLTVTIIMYKSTKIKQDWYNSTSTCVLVKCALRNTYLNSLYIFYENFASFFN